MTRLLRKGRLGRPFQILYGGAFMNNKPGAPFDMELFKNPPAECAVTYAWAWNAPITKEGIDEQLKDFSKAGIRSLYILPFPPEFRPTIMKTFLSPPYLSEEFFALVSYALHRAAEMGMVLWIYDEGGWPSGGACGHTMKENPEALPSVLTTRTVLLPAGKCYAEGEGTIAAFIGHTRVFGGYIAEANTEITEYYTFRRMENGNRVDYTNASVTDTFIKNTYEPYKKAAGDLFGKALPLIFTDEPGQMLSSVPKDFFALFEAEYGYDIRNRLYAVCDPLVEEEDDRRARVDYARLIGRLMKENCFERLSHWCEENGVYFGGHLDNEHVPTGGTRNGYFSHVDCLRSFGVPGIDVIWDQIRYPIEDTPVMAEGSSFFARVAPSAARQSEKNIALSETFSVYGESFFPDEARFVVGHQAIRGINAFNFMSIPYGRERMAALAMRPGFCPEKPGFFHLKAINDYTARLSYLARLGKPIGDTALYYPAADFAASAESSAAAEQSYNAAGAALEARHVFFDIIDDAGILAAEETDEGLKIGDAVYRHIVVPKCRYMPTDVYKRIEKHLGEGEKILPVRDPYLRTMVRDLEEDALWFFFREKDTGTKECIPVPQGKRAYRLDLSLGEIYFAGENTIDVSPAVGETAVYLITERMLKTADREAEFKVEISDFSPLYMDKFTIFEGGIKKERMDVPKVLPHTLSAEITYEARYALPYAPKAGEIYRLTLLQTHDTASISIDGETVAVFGPTPMVALIDGAKLPKEGALQITASNTASGEIAEKRAMIESFYPVEEQGVYAKRKMYALEARYSVPEIGSLVIEKTNAGG